MGILGIALGGIAIVLVGILWLRLHPLLTLLAASVCLLALTPEELLIQRRMLERAVPVKQIDETQQIDVTQQIDEAPQIDTAQTLIGVSQPLETGPSAAKTYWLVDDKRFGALDSAAQVQLQTVVRENRYPAEGEPLFWYSANPSQVIRPGQWLIPTQPVQLPDGYRWQRVGAELADGFASTFQRLGIPVAMAAIIGLCLLQSGTATRLVAAIMSLLGERGTGPALTASGFVLGVPVFFDNVFYLLLPLAKAVARKRPQAYLTAVMAIIVGATMAHSLVPPTPGPLLIAGPLGVSIGQMMLGGCIVGGIAASAGFFYGAACHRWIDLKLQPMDDEPAVADPATPKSTAGDQPQRRQLPLWLAAMPILFPIALFGLAELLGALVDAGAASSMLTAVHVRLEGLSDPNLVFLFTGLLSVGLLRAVADASTVAKAVSRGLADAGTIILITCAGGSFGKSLQQLELAAVLSQSFTAVTNPWGLLCLAFGLTTVIRAAQGSATVAMITSVSIIAPIAEVVSLPYHPVYIALAIGSGSKPLPWMNDSGFWQVATMTGMTAGQTFRSFSLALTIMGLIGFAVTLLAAWLLPFAA